MYACQIFQHCTLGFEEEASMMTLSPIFSPSVAMVTTSSPVDGVPVREDPVLATEWMEGAGDLETGTGRGKKEGKTCHRKDMLDATRKTGSRWETNPT